MEITREIKKDVVCPVCGHVSSARELFEEFPNFSLFLCSVCDLVFSSPMRGMTPEEYQKMYGTEFHSGFATALSTGQEFFFRKNKARMGAKRILDIGTSTGLFVHEALRRGFDAVGLETDPDAIEKGKVLFPEISVFNQNLNDFLLRGDKFDFVTLFEVLEHVEDPLTLLSLARKLLNPQGKLVVFVPNRKRSPKLYAEMVERGIDLPPHHLTKWSKKSLHFIFKKINAIKIFSEDIGKYRFPILPGVGIASRVRKNIISIKKPLQQDVSKPSRVYRDSLRIVFKVLSIVRSSVDRLLFFWIDSILKLKGFEKDGLYIEGIFENAKNS